MDEGENDLSRKCVMMPATAEDRLDRIESPIACLLGSRLWRQSSQSRCGIGLRLLAAVLLFSSLVTLTLTALQLYLDYDREVSVIETRLDEIGRSYSGSIGESLWDLDQNQLELQLNGILRLPDIQAAEVSEIADRPNPIRIAVGKRGPGSAITRLYPLDYVVQGAKRPIGVLYVEATLTDVYRELLTRALVILASQAAKTFLVSFFIVYMFQARSMPSSDETCLSCNGRKRACARANSDFAITPRPHPIGSGRPARTTSLAISRSG